MPQRYLISFVFIFLFFRFLSGVLIFENGGDVFLYEARDSSEFLSALFVALLDQLEIEGEEPKQIVPLTIVLTVIFAKSRDSRLIVPEEKVKCLCR